VRSPPCTLHTAPIGGVRPGRRPITQILINLERGADGQLAGQLTTGAGEVVVFTGWLHLLRLLEDEVRAIETPSFEY
jgi:hypothetical protein